MFKFSELVHIDLEITSNCQAKCPMCLRNVAGGLENPYLTIKSWSLDMFKKIVSEEVLLQVKQLSFCGNFGDPILNKDLIKILSYIVETNSKIRIDLHTNGGINSADWWEKLAKVLPKDHRVIFALDGLSDTHSIYRINTKFDTVIKNASTFIENGGIAEWCFIVFKHNEHQISEAKNMSEQLGFQFFKEKHSIRFFDEPIVEIKNRNNEIIGYIEPPTSTKVKLVDSSLLNDYKSKINAINIKCHVKNKKSVYIDFNGHVYPCAFLASVPYTYFESKNHVINELLIDRGSQYHSMISNLKGIDSIDATKHTLCEIIDNDNWVSTWNKFHSVNKSLVCTAICGENTFSTPFEQIVK